DVAVRYEAGAATFYTADRFNDAVWVVKDEAVVRTFKAGREPIALALTPDGRTLIAANHLPEQSPATFDASAAVRFIDTQTGKTDVVRLINGAMNVRDIVLSPDGKYVFITGIIGHFQRMPNDVNGGWMNENVLFVLDVKQRKYIHTQSLDDYSIGSANPWGVSISDDEQFVIVAASGSCDVLLIHLPRFSAMLDDYAGYAPRKTEPVDFPMMMRVPVGLKGVRSAAMVNGQVFASSYFEDALMKITPNISKPGGFVPGLVPKDILEIPRNKKLRPDTTTPYRDNIIKKNRLYSALPPFVLSAGIQFQRELIRLGPEPVWDNVRYGEMLFHDAVVCKEHWQSCSSCHPDGRSDCLNWDLLNDGQDNPKNTKSLLLSHQTPPSMAHGVRREAETAVRKGFETILMIPAAEDEAQAVDEYLKNLTEVVSPHKMPNGELSKSAQRGRRLFNSGKTGCSNCHPEPLFTDMQMHDAGTRSAVDTDDKFDTPTLIEVWRTAPYLHDGRYTALRQVFTEGKHYSKELTEPEIDDLVEYVLSL
ncbi:MAG: hypothetical protein LBN39_07160, partial [Planctomycetaceae bacterium]|nr:hypothetical protein [Planctomycetaceae bacterium]